ncbi:tRNA pseudouridine synthase A-like isoform X2 [Juglans microcarpa x Juglans regia]|uniref:tRNA pseudouridine synthase A-like isoform X2 n=1 Tax=Juglans microcarpa x Juglans regia TaxID=2249226 RepID=UPI001B7E9957|nr:tRNA pseudouridine synthase A-like isoform X2 [Juglans microcarpa x Juglans regia]
MTENLKHLLDIVAESPHRPSKIAKTAAQNLINDEEEQQEAPMGPSPRTQRYLVAIEYIGTRFSGSQQQPNFRTVVGVLEEAFHKFIGQPVSIFCSSRTDAGVHALSNVCHVDIQRISKRKPGEVLPPHEPTVVRRAVNHFLQNEGDIMVIDVQCVPADFHARFKAQERTYFYRLLSGPEPLSTFERDRAWHVPEELDILAMQEACKVLVGHHDFSSFRAAGCQAKSPIRTLDELNVSKVVSTPYFPSIVGQNNLTMEDLHASSNKSESDLPVSSISIDDRASGFNGEASLGFGIRRRHRCFVVTARARSFLYHQVRLLVGVLKAVGTGNLTISDVERILNAKSVTATSPMAPACGLYLGHVKYELPREEV